MGSVLADPRVESALRGETIYGDDFSPEEIAAWFEDEREGYASLPYADADGLVYVYHAMNRVHGFRHLPPARRFRHAMGFGAAYGLELLPLVDRVDGLTVVDPSDKFQCRDIGGRPARWVKPEPSGRLPFPDGDFDLITCLGVLHHIPNVSAVVRELARVLAPGGFLLVREPTTSMGDWRRVRPALTKRERGIPADLLVHTLQNAGLTVLRRTILGFRPWMRVCQLLKLDLYSHTWSTVIDSWLSALTAWNTRYHTENALRKISPGVAYVVVQKPSGSTGPL